jgi:alcohol dehydrogenase class IV
MAFRISAKSEVLFGQETSHQIGKRLAGFGCERIICIYDKGVKNAGLVDPIVEEISKKDIAVVHFDSVLADPPDTMINECGELARYEEVDGVLGIGGGSSLDTAKAVNVLLANPGTIDLYYGLGAKQKPSRPLVLVPTTAGTGSEITSMSVVTDTKKVCKMGVGGAATVASLAVVDPLLTRGLPPDITASTGMDAFSHALEAYTSKSNNMMSDMLAEKALPLIIEYLPKAVENGTDMQARTQMSFACLIAGMAFNDAIVHLGHAFGHTLGTHFHIPHGIGCAIAQPAVVNLVADIMPEKVRRVGEFFGLKPTSDMTPAASGEAVGRAINEFLRQIGIPSLKELDIQESDLEKLAQGTVADGCFYFVPKPMEYDDVLQALKRTYDTAV